MHVMYVVHVAQTGMAALYEYVSIKHYSNVHACIYILIITGTPCAHDALLQATTHLPFGQGENQGVKFVCKAE